MKTKTIINLFGHDISIPAPVIKMEQDASGALVPVQQITDIEKWLDDPQANLGNIQEKLMIIALSMVREATATTVSDKFDPTCITLLSTIGLSNELQDLCSSQTAGEYFSIDKNGRVFLPAKWAKKNDWDCDGDSVQVFMFTVTDNLEIRQPGDTSKPTSKTYGVICKQPCKTLMPVLELIEHPQPIFTGIDDKVVDYYLSIKTKQYTVEDWLSVMNKALTSQPIGLITNRWWAKMLQIAHNRGGDLVTTMIDVLKENGDAYRDDLEGKTMKAVRGKNNATEIPSIFTESVGAMSPLTGTLYGTKGNISKAWATTITQIFDEMLNPQFDEGQTFNQPQGYDEAWTSKPQISDKSLLYYLMQTGRVRITELPVQRDGIFPAIQFSLLNAEGKQTSFVWTKSTGENTTGYVCTLYPIWAYCPFEKVSKVMHPLEHMGKWLSRELFASCNITSHTYVQAMLANGGSIGIERSIRKYLETYGEILPSTQKGDYHEITPVSGYFAQSTIAIDHASIYGWNKNVSLDQMIQTTMSAYSGFGGIHLFASGNSRAVKRHFLAEKDNFPAFVRKNGDAHFGQPHRVGRNASLLRRCGTMVKARVAIIDSGSNIQCYITPSGITKSTPEAEVFLPQISFEEQPGYQLKTFPKFDGTQSTAWVSPHAKRDCKPVGKFLCVNGSRFEPAQHTQCYDEQNNPVDFLIPIQEIGEHEKELASLWLSKATKGNLRKADGTIIENIWFLDWVFFRSAAASENIKPRYRKQWSCKGFMALMLASSLQAVGYNHYQRVDRRKLKEADKLIWLANNLPNVYKKSTLPCKGLEGSGVDFVPSVETDDIEAVIISDDTPPEQGIFTIAMLQGIATPLTHDKSKRHVENLVPVI